MIFKLFSVDSRFLGAADNLNFVDFEADRRQHLLFLTSGLKVLSSSGRPIVLNNCLANNCLANNCLTCSKVNF